MLGGNSSFGKENTTYSNEVWEGSPSQTAMQNAYQAGAERILITDNALRALVKWGQAIVGDDNDSSDGKFNRFSSEAALDNWVRNRLTKYCYENGFYGIVLNDEPVYGYTQNLGTVYQSIKRVAKSLGIEVYIHLNLLPADVDKSMLGADTSLERGELYRSYIENIILATNAERLSLDIYPFMDWGFKTGYFSMLQIFTDVCKDYNVNTSLCVQTFASQSHAYRTELSEEEIYFQIYNAMGLGFDHIYFYTYLTDGGEVNNGSSFINTDGKKTEVYNAAQKVIAEAQAFADFILKYDYQGCALYAKSIKYQFDASHFIANYFSYAPQDEKSMVFVNDSFAKLNSVSVDDDLLFVTELKNESGQYMYMVQNVLDPYYIGYTDGFLFWQTTVDGNLTATLNFGADCKGVYEYSQGEWIYVAIENGEYTCTLDAAMAVFVIPVY